MTLSAYCLGFGNWTVIPREWRVVFDDLRANGYDAVSLSFSEGEMRYGRRMFEQQVQAAHDYLRKKKQKRAERRQRRMARKEALLRFRACAWRAVVKAIPTIVIVVGFSMWMVCMWAAIEVVRMRSFGNVQF